MPEIVEGYKTSQDVAAPVAGGADSWIDGLRRDLRREMIREIAMRRIKQTNGLAGAGQQFSDRPGRMFEAFLVGVTVTLASAWLCSLIRKKDDE